MKCSKCKGQGYKDKTIQDEFDLEAIRVWCYECKGSGKIKYTGDRSDDIAWGGE